MVCWTCVAVWATIGLILYKFLFSGKKGKPDIQKKDWRKDVVYLYQFPRAKEVPNFSPFCLKVETFLKANNIPYERTEDVTKPNFLCVIMTRAISYGCRIYVNLCEVKECEDFFELVGHCPTNTPPVCPVRISRSQYGMLPFVELNGEHIADSQIIINRLTRHFDIKQLSSAKDRAVARAVGRMADIHTFAVQYYFKINDSGNTLVKVGYRDSKLPELLFPILVPLLGYYMRRKVYQRIAGSVGTLSTENYKDILKKDYDAYQTLLGQQKFLFGDGLDAADCSVFGQLATTLYLPYNCYAKDLLKEEYTALVEYCDRIKETVFGKNYSSE